MRTKIMIIAVTAALLAASSPTWAAAPTKTSQEVTVICQQLLADYAIYRDHMDADAFVNTFTKDAVLKLGTGTYTGPEGLRKEIEQHARPAIAHMIMFTTSQIRQVSETVAKGVSYAIILNGDRHVGPGDKPIEMAGITAGSEYLSEFTLTKEGWKISRMENRGLFRGQGIAKH